MVTIDKPSGYRRKVLMFKLRILIADDERPARKYLRTMLEGYEDVEVCAEAANGSEALELIADTKPDLCLMDLQMPEMGGIEVARLLPPGSATLVVFVTAGEAGAGQNLESGLFDYLLKPVAPEELRKIVDRARTFAQSREAG